MFFVTETAEDAEWVKRFLNDWLCLVGTRQSNGVGDHLVSVKETDGAGRSVAAARALRTFCAKVKRVV